MYRDGHDFPEVEHSLQSSLMRQHERIAAANAAIASMHLAKRHVQELKRAAAKAEHGSFFFGRNTFGGDRRRTAETLGRGSEGKCLRRRHIRWRKKPLAIGAAPSAIGRRALAVEMLARCFAKKKIRGSGRLRSAQGWCMHER